MPIEPRFHLSGATALLVDVATGAFNLTLQQRLWTLCAEQGALRRLPGVSSFVLGVNNVAVRFDPLEVDLQQLKRDLADAWNHADPSEDRGSEVQIPVTYDTSPAFDLTALASSAQLSVEQVVDLHTSVEYRVACIGWVPGFAFLVGLSPRLVAPRRATPRLRVPPGSVGIGGAQTGVIPIEVPSGWNLLGRTEIELFSSSRETPCLLRAGDRVRFVQRGSIA